MNDFTSLLPWLGLLLFGFAAGLLLRSAINSLKQRLALQRSQSSQNFDLGIIGRDSVIECDRKVEFDQIVSELTTSFMDADLDQIYPAFERTLARLGEHFDLDRAILIVFDHERETTRNLEWISHRIERSPDSYRPIEYHELDWCYEQLSQREPVLIPTLADLPSRATEERLYCEKHEVRSLMLLPLSISGELYGALEFDSSGKPQDWLEGLQAGLWQISYPFAFALDRLRNQGVQAFQQRGLHLLNEITHSALHAPDAQWMLEIAADKLMEFLHADACVILLGDVAGQSYRNLAIGGEEPSILQPSAQDLEKLAPFLTELRQGECLMINDLDNSEYAELPFGAAHKSLFAFPLLESDLTLGAAILFFKKAVRLNALEVELSKRIAGQLVLAVTKIHALADARAQLDETETLRKAASVIAATLEPGEAVDRILDELGKVVPYDSACVQILSNGFLEIMGGRGWSDNEAVLGMRFAVPSDNPNTIVVETKKPFILGDAPKVYEHFKYPPHNHIRSWLGVPLIVRGNLIGMFAIDKMEPNYFREDHVAQVSAFSDQVAVLLDNARLFENTQRKALELEALRATVTDITAELDLSILLRAIVERASTLLNVTGGELGLFDDKNQTLKIVVSYNLGMTGQDIHLERDEGIMGIVAKTLEPASVDDYVSWEGRSPHYTGVPLHAVAAAPLLIGGRLLGVLGIGTIDPTRRLSATDLTLLNLFAQQAAIAVENARLFETLQTQAITDPLTGLFNRRGLFDFGQHEIEIAIRKNRPFSVILFDIDHFKLVNDRHSHAVGDDVLLQLARRCSAILRRSDILGRYGGEEFAVLLPETELQDAIMIANRFRLVVSESPLDTRRGPIGITISCGVTTAIEEIPDLAVLLDQADTALYASKQAGRNQTTAFERIRV